MMCYQKFILSRVATLYLLSCGDSFHWLELGLSQSSETQTLGQVQTPLKSKTKLLPAAHLFLFRIKVSKVSNKVSEKTSIVMGGSTCMCLEEENKAQTISHGQGITGKIQIGGDLRRSSQSTSFLLEIISPLSKMARATCMEDIIGIHSISPTSKT